jgi:molecular chaperone GrpE (heat shock protein)
MSNAIGAEEEFAAAMQQLSAEAEKTLPADAAQQEPLFVSDQHEGDLGKRLDVLGERVHALERVLLERLDQIASGISSKQLPDFALQCQKIEEQLAAIRSTESVNQKLFDSLHAELLKYRDNFLHESLQKPFIHDLVYLYDHLTSLCEQLRSAAQEKSKRGQVAQWRDNLENAIHSLVEIFHRFDVKEIEPREHFDRSYHRAISYEPADFPEEDGRIVMRVRRGFMWRGKLIRPEEVIVRRYG